MPEINIFGITIVRQQHGPDHVYINTDLPEATFPFKEHLSLRFEAGRGTGPDYVEKHFPGVPVNFVEEVSRPIPFSRQPTEEEPS